MRYTPETQLVLKDISFGIKAGKRLGVVGKVGSGRSSITSCISRLAEFESGTVMIDDVNIKNVTLEKLRGKIYCVR